MAKILLEYLLKMCLVVIHEAQGKEKVFSEIHKAFLFFRVVGKQIRSVCGYQTTHMTYALLWINISVRTKSTCRDHIPITTHQKLHLMGKKEDFIQVCPNIKAVKNRCNTLGKTSLAEEKAKVI